MNQKNSLGLNKCFLDLDDPFELFEKWFVEAKKKEINDPNALALGTASKEYIPSVRIVLLKGFDKSLTNLLVIIPFYFFLLVIQEPMTISSVINTIIHTLRNEQNPWSSMSERVISIIQIIIMIGFFHPFIEDLNKILVTYRTFFSNKNFYINLL